MLFIVHLPRRGDVHRSSFVGFQGGQWVSAHIDEIQASSEDALTLDEAFSASISDLFYNMDFVSRRSKKSSERFQKCIKGKSNRPNEEIINHDGMHERSRSDAYFEQQEVGGKDTTTSFSQSTKEEFESMSEPGTKLEPTQSMSPEEVSEKMVSVWLMYIYTVYMYMSLMVFIFHSCWSVDKWPCTVYSTTQLHPGCSCLDGKH